MKPVKLSWRARVLAAGASVLAVLGFGGVTPVAAVTPTGLPPQPTAGAAPVHMPVVISARVVGGDKLRTGREFEVEGVARGLEGGGRVKLEWRGRADQPWRMLAGAVVDVHESGCYEVKGMLHTKGLQWLRVAQAGAEAGSGWAHSALMAVIVK